MKIVIADPKEGKAIQKEEEDSKCLMRMKIGQTFKGEPLDLTGYEFEITGRSDKIGFPMRKDAEGSVRRKVLSAVKCVGISVKRKGQKVRQNVAGNTISLDTAQVNVKVIKHGTKSLFEAPAEEAPAEGEAPAEA